MVRYHYWIFLQLVQGYLDCFLQLRIVSGGYRRRIILHLNIRRNSYILDFPLAVQAVNRSARRGNEASV
jgi:hypothetical protein